MENIGQASLLRRLTPALLMLCISHLAPWSAAAADWVTLRPAAQQANAPLAPLTAVTRAGNRIVAVGDHGVILLSDDGGHDFRQARSVPVSTMLTSVSFIDDKTGLAVGHDGVVLSTSDGGENWSLRSDERGTERPLLAVHMLGITDAVAIGLFGQLQISADGGTTWTARAADSDADMDRHLYAITRSPTGTLLVFGESGTVFRSTDRGDSWATIRTGDQGSLWTGMVTAKGTVLAAGLRGRLYRSEDDGKSWRPIDSGTTQSLTGLVQCGDGEIVAVGYGGTILVSRDDGRTFTPAPPHRNGLMTAITVNDTARPIAVSLAGVVGEIPVAAAEGHNSMR